MNGFVDDKCDPISLFHVLRRLDLPPDDRERIAAMSVEGDGPRRIALLLGQPERIPVYIKYRVKTLLIWRSATIAIDDVSRNLALHPGNHPFDIPAVSIGDDGPRPIALLFDNPERIPDVSADDIEDRGKAGVLAKSLLIWQLSVFLANCFARWDQSLPLSLLEITTIGHSLCSIIAMVLWWYKPHSIGEATVINRQGPLPSLPNAGWRKVLSHHFVATSFRAGLYKVLAGDDEVMGLPKTITIVAIAVLYGLPHLLGLSVHFPTFAEQLCWKIATFMVIGSPLLMCVILWIMTYIEKLSRLESAVGYSLLILIYILLVVYPISSMFLVGESVRQIFALPVESFREPQLATYLPSFS